MKILNRRPKPAGRKPDPSAEQATLLRRSTPWHAVSIVTKAVQCEAAHALRGKRFLSAAAPRLPLPGCSMRNACDCAYKHHADRRAPPRRKDESIGFGPRRQPEDERRVNRSRRATD